MSLLRDKGTGDLSDPPSPHMRRIAGSSLNLELGEEGGLQTQRGPKVCVHGYLCGAEKVNAIKLT